jgi:hypothetical protein
MIVYFFIDYAFGVIVLKIRPAVLRLIGSPAFFTGAGKKIIVFTGLLVVALAADSKPIGVKMWNRNCRNCPLGCRLLRSFGNRRY